MKNKLLVCICALAVISSAADKIYACCQNPVASFSGPTSVYCGDEATFTCTSTDADSDISRWYWTGGGSPATGSSSTFTTKWCTTGDKTVKLKVWDNDRPDCCGYAPSCIDKHDTAEKTVTVLAVDIIDVDSSVEIACAGTTVTFTATTSPADKCGCVKWMGGGDPPTASGGSCEFETKWDTPGTKTVTAWGCGSDKSKNVLIFGGEIEPQDPCPDNGPFLLLWNPASASLIENFKAKDPSNQPSGITYKWEITSGNSNAHIVGSSTSSMVALKADQLGDLTLKLTYTYEELTCVSTLDITVQKPSITQSSIVCNGQSWRCPWPYEPPLMRADRHVHYYVRDSSGNAVPHAKWDETWSGGCNLTPNDVPTDCAGHVHDHIWIERNSRCDSAGLLCTDYQTIKVAGWPATGYFWTNNLEFRDGDPDYNSCPMIFLLGRSYPSMCN